MNRYGWKQLESIVREDWLRERGELVVVTGVHYPDNPEKMNNNVSIPTHFYKVVYDPELNEAISFWFPNEALSSDELIIGITTIEQIETDTGHELFSNLSKSKKVKIKELSLKEVW
ncbi:DNA/RNA non-specific endonuclease [Vibrio splendidus]|nr:DNA/RNA non-specific endonuclease [Vibrio splendidus]